MRPMPTKDQVEEYHLLMHDISNLKAELGQNPDEERDYELRLELQQVYNRRRELIRETSESGLARS